MSWTDTRRGTARRGTTRTGTPARTPVVAVLLCCGYLGGLASIAVVWSRGRQFDSVVGPFMMGLILVGAVLAVRVAWRRDLPRRTRVAWRWIATSYVVLVAANAVFSQVADREFPTAGDGVRLLFAPCLLVGLLLLLPPPRTPLERHKLNLDNAIVTAAGAMLLWYLVIGPALVDRGAPLAVTLAATAYPILDLALIFGATQVVFRPGPHSRQGPSQLVAVGVLFLVTSDVSLGYQRLNSPSELYGGLQFACWLTAHFLFALAAVNQARAVAKPAPSALRPVTRAALWLPYLAVAAGYLLLVVVVTRELPFYPIGGLVLGAVALTGLVQARQLLASQENHLLARTDGLTGLANRSRLHERLARAVALADRRRGQVAVLLIDLDGFKDFNDTLGHEAGDEILISFARLLEASARPTDLVARLGGDEFVVVLTAEDPGSAADAISARITDATQVPLRVAGQTVMLRASIGIAVAQTPGCGASELLDRADAAMYRAKRAGRTRG